MRQTEEKIEPLKIAAVSIFVKQCYKSAREWAVHPNVLIYLLNPYMCLLTGRHECKHMRSVQGPGHANLRRMQKRVLL